MSTLRAAVSAEESGQLITLSGQTDIATVAKLRRLVTAQLPGGTMHLTIDVSGLSFADSASVRVLVIGARTLKERGGGLVLLRPQRGVAGMLEITRRRSVDHSPGRSRGHGGDRAARRDCLLTCHARARTGRNLRSSVVPHGSADKAQRQPNMARAS